MMFCRVGCSTLTLDRSISSKSIFFFVLRLQEFSRVRVVSHCTCVERHRFVCADDSSPTSRRPTRPGNTRHRTEPTAKPVRVLPRWAETKKADEVAPPHEVALHFSPQSSTHRVS